MRDDEKTGSKPVTEDNEEFGRLGPTPHGHTWLRPEPQLEDPTPGWAGRIGEEGDMFDPALHSEGPAGRDSAPAPYSNQPQSVAHSMGGVLGESRGGPGWSWLRANWRRKRVWLPVALLAALVLGFSLGGGGAAEAPQRAVERVEVPVPGPVQVKEVAREVAPKSCTDALDLAEQIVQGPVADALRISARSLNAAAANDVPALLEASKEMKTATDRLDQLVGSYNRVSMQCRAAAK